MPEFRFKEPIRVRCIEGERYGHEPKTGVEYDMTAVITGFDDYGYAVIVITDKDGPYESAGWSLNRFEQVKEAGK